LGKGKVVDIQDIGAIGELTAAVATIVTLLYLARQIQLGTKTIQASNLSTMVDAMSAMHDTHMQIVDFWEPAQSGSRELEDHEVSALHGHCVQMFLGFETVFLFHLNGTVDDQYFEARARTIKRAGTFPYFKQWFREWGRDLYDGRFVQFVNEQWSGGSDAPASLRLETTA
jgi:hypothetical protein